MQSLWSKIGGKVQDKAQYVDVADLRILASGTMLGSPVYPIEILIVRN